jgi:hypothetical protein
VPLDVLRHVGTLRHDVQTSLASIVEGPLRQVAGETATAELGIDLGVGEDAAAVLVAIPGEAGTPVIHVHLVLPRGDVVLHPHHFFAHEVPPVVLAPSDSAPVPGAPRAASAVTVRQFLVAAPVPSLRSKNAFVSLLRP